MRAYEFLYEKSLKPEELSKRDNLQRFISKIKSGDKFELVSGGTVVLDNNPKIITDLGLSTPKWPVHPQHPNWIAFPVASDDTDVSNDDETDKFDPTAKEWILLSKLQKTNDFAGGGQESETIPIKPSNLIPDENYRDANEVATMIINGMKQPGIPKSLANPIIQAVNIAQSNNINQPIKDGGEHLGIIQKYAGEYLGPLALIADNITDSDVTAALKAHNQTSFTGSKIMFPTSTTQTLIDSIVQFPNGIKMKISSKQKTGGGAASALSGLKITPEIEKAYPSGTHIIKTLIEKSAILGPLILAVELGIIKEEDKVIMETGKSLEVSQLSSRLKEILSNQASTTQSSGYRVFFHLMMGITNQLSVIVNSGKEFGKAVLAALNNNSYIQLLTNGQLWGAKDLKLSYSTKFPIVYKGEIVLWTQKNYYATGIKGKANFKLVG